MAVETGAIGRLTFLVSRADLEDAKCKAEYERGYQMTIDFFNAHL